MEPVQTSAVLVPKTQQDFLCWMKKACGKLKMLEPFTFITEVVNVVLMARQRMAGEGR